jgi:hypothetical protein
MLTQNVASLGFIDLGPLLLECPVPTRLETFMKRYHLSPSDGTSVIQIVRCSAGVLVMGRRSKA